MRRDKSLHVGRYRGQVNRIAVAYQRESDTIIGPQIIGGSDVNETIHEAGGTSKDIRRRIDDAYLTGHIDGYGYVVFQVVIDINYQWW